VIGHIPTADSPEELDQMIDDDFGTATPQGIATLGVKRLAD